MGEKSPRRVALSWLPEVMMTRAFALSSSSIFEVLARAFRGGTARSKRSPRFGIDCREECRTFNLDDLDFVTDFYLLYCITFLQDETARLLIDEMKREAAS